MTRTLPLRAGLAIVVLVILGWIGWTAVQATRADNLAAEDPVAALRLDPDHPQALQKLAWRQFGRGENDAATATARHLLTVEPGQGDAFAVLALAALRRGDANATALMRIALQRAPRDTELRAQAAARILKAGDVGGAMSQIDALLRLSPDTGPVLFPALADQARDPRFAGVLGATLARDPPWRGPFLVALDRSGKPAAIDNVLGWLQQHGEMSDVETARWLDRMIADGRWGDAFAHWLGLLGSGVARVPAVRDGGFEEEPSQLGFGWRNDSVHGVVAELEAGAGTRGSRAAHFHFIGQAARGNLRQALFLPPGRYRLTLRARGDFLRSDQGLRWTIRCDKGAQIAQTDALDGSFDWRALETPFEVPATKCPGQWLELTNPAVAGSAQQVSGDLWTDDIAITPDRAISSSS
jgi:hypothetical protein